MPKQRLTKETRATYRIRKPGKATSATEKITLRWSEIASAGEPLLLKRNGEPMAVVIKYSDYRRLKLVRTGRRGKSVHARKEPWKKELAAMAADSEIQRELGLINREFAQTESDGLEKI